MCKSSWIIHRIRQTDRKRESVNFFCVCCQLSRFMGSPRFWNKFSGSISSRSGFLPLFTLWLPSAQTIPTRQFSNSATTGMGENSPTTYALQGSSLKAWENFHPGRTARQMCLKLFLMFVFHEHTQGGKSSWQSHGISFLHLYSNCFFIIWNLFLKTSLMQYSIILDYLSNFQLCIVQTRTQKYCQKICSYWILLA